MTAGAAPRAGASCRRATRADLAAVAALERATFGTDVYPAFFFRQALDLWPALLWVAEDGAGGLAPGGVAGYALAAPPDAAAPSATPGGRDLCLLSLAVDGRQRGRGVGGALLEAVLAEAAARGVGVWLTVHPENPAARLYRRHGFRDEALDPAYFGPGEPRLVLRRALGAGRGDLPELSAPGGV